MRYCATYPTHVVSATQGCCNRLSRRCTTSIADIAPHERWARARAQSTLSTAHQPAFQAGRNRRVMADQAASTTANESWRVLVRWSDLPHWQQDNHHVRAGYRRASYSYRRSLRSVFQWHNESVNIWSHLVPAMLSPPIAGLVYSGLASRYDMASRGDVVAMSCFFLAVTVCLTMSASFHTFSNHSPAVAKWWLQLDYVGIVVLTAGSFVPSIYYQFWCEWHLQLVYWSMVSAPPLPEARVLM